MTTGSVFPQFISARPDPGNQKTFDQFVMQMSDAGKRGAQGMTGALSGVRDTISQALSIPRNAGGSLDLQVDQLRQMERELEAVARATREYAQATRAAAIASGENSRARTEEIRAAFELARVEDQNLVALRQKIGILNQVQAELNQTASATDAVVAATRRGTTAYGINETSLRGSRVAMIQTGQQLQDMAIQFQAGTRSSVILAQQLPQLFFALTSLEGSANKTADKIGRFATVMSGPFSIFVVAGAAVLGTLIDNLFGAGKEANKSGSAIEKLTNKLDLSKNSYKALIAVVEEYNAAQSKSTALTYDAIIAAEKEIQTQIDLAKAKLAAARVTAEVSAGQGTGGTAGAFTGGRVSVLEATIADLEKKLREAGVAGSTERTKLATDERYAIEVAYNAELVKWQERRLANQVTQIELDAVELALTKKKAAALEAYDKANRKTRDDSSRTASLAQFITPVSGATVTGRFNEQRTGHRHGGLDLAAPTGTAVRAPQIGVVEAVGFSPTLGKYVVIDHGGGTKTRFGHLSDNAIVSEGARVEQGDTIGKVGSTGRSTGPHLHYEVTVNGKKVDPTKGLFPVDDVKVNEAAERAVEKAKQAAEALDAFGAGSAEKIARINERFDEQPRLIDAAAAATRDLDKTIAELAERKPPGFAQMIAEAQAAKGTIEEALVRPFEQLREESERRIQIQTLLASGREVEVQQLELIWKIEQDLGSEEELRAKVAALIVQGRTEEAAILQQLLADYPQLKQDAIDQVAAEEAVNEKLRQRREILDQYLSATRSVKDELVSIFAGEGSIGNIGKVFKRLQAQVTVEKLFGDQFSKLDEWIKGQSGLGKSIDYFGDESERAGKSAGSLADSLDGAARRIAASPVASAPGTGVSAFDAAFGSIYGTGAANDNSAEIEAAVGETTNEIVVVGKKIDKLDDKLDPRKWAAEIGKATASPIADALKPLLGDKLAGKIGSVLSGVIEGKISAGTTGAVLGGLRDAFGGAGNGGLGDFVFGPALAGAQTGTQVSGLLDSLGIGNSTSGAQIGGAIGSATGIPGGDIIGSIIGSIVGEIFKKTKRGSATLTVGSDGVSVGSTRGNSPSRIEAATQAGDSISDALNQIAEQLGGSADGPVSVSIGVRDGNYRVDPTGQGITKTANGAIDFGKDQEAAIRFAILDAIKDGVITGISEGARRLIQGGKDLEKQIAKAIDFEGVFKRLRAIKDPVGAAIDALNKEFTRLNDIFKEAGASAAQFAELEELYGIERAAAIKEAGERVTGALKALLSDLTINNDALSLRDRLSAAQAAYQPLAARVRAGDTTAFDDYAQAARDLLAIQRDLSGSQPDYFALLEEVTALTRTTLSAQEALLAASSGGASPFDPAAAAVTVDNTQVVGAIAGQTDTLASLLTAANENLGTLILQGATGTYGSIDTSGWAYGNYY